jgi:hypothetical protein
MTRSVWDEMVAKRAAAETDEPVEYGPDDCLPTYDEWKRYDDQRREHDETRHATTRSYASYGS